MKVVLYLAIKLLTVLLFNFALLSHQAFSQNLVLINGEKNNRKNYDFFLRQNTKFIAFVDYLFQKRKIQEEEKLIQLYERAVLCTKKRDISNAIFLYKDIVDRSLDHHWPNHLQTLIFKSYLSLSKLDSSSRGQWLQKAIEFDLTKKHSALISDQKERNYLSKIQRENIHFQWKIPEEWSSAKILVNGQPISSMQSHIQLLRGPFRIAIFSSSDKPIDKITSIDELKFLTPSHRTIHPPSRPTISFDWLGELSELDTHSQFFIFRNNKAVPYKRPPSQAPIILAKPIITKARAPFYKRKNFWKIMGVIVAAGAIYEANKKTEVLRPVHKTDLILP